jgi:hypothetical protein
MLRKVQALGVRLAFEEAQGYLYAKPLPAAEFEVYLKGRRLGLPAEGSHENRPDRGRGIAASAQKSST